MQINSRVIDIIKEFDVNHDDCIGYMLMKYFDLEVSYIPDILKAQVNRMGIFEIDNYGTLQWKIPLFGEQVTAFSWVKTEYMQLFKDANPDRRGTASYCVSRMKKLFANHPEIRKDEVLNATAMYIRNTNSDYIRMSHYFISKGIGAERTEDILIWIEKFRLAEKSEEGRTSITRTMQ